MNNNPVVSISCITYNHAPYIRQCIDGFLMQKTDFSIEVLIHDDASTDGTTDIIREYEQKYPKIIKPIYQTENQYSQGVDVFTIYNINRAQGKYIAYCEGDDYWIDPYKLQKQKDFLEKNPEYGLVNTDVNVLEQETGYIINNYNKDLLNTCSNDRIVSIQDILNGKYRIMTPTVLLKKEIVKSYIESEGYLFISRHFPMGDTPTWIYFAQNSKLFYIDEATTIYRKNNGSLSRPNAIVKRISFALSSIELRMYYISIYENQFTPEFIDKIERMYQTSILQYISFCPKYSPHLKYTLKSSTKKRIFLLRKYTLMRLIYKFFIIVQVDIKSRLKKLLRVF
jgi:glycosyltransferase involved in cell wall biosynthesis